MFTTIPPFGVFFLNDRFYQKPEDIDQYTCATYFDDFSGIDYQNHGIWYRFSSQNRFTEKCVGHGNF